MDDRFVTVDQVREMGYIPVGSSSLGIKGEEQKLKVLGWVREVETKSGCKAVASLDFMNDMSVYAEPSYKLYVNKNIAFNNIPELTRKIERHKADIKEAEEQIKKYQEDIQKFNDFLIGRGNLIAAKQLMAKAALYIKENE